jgi:cell division protein FtsZ
MSMDSIEIINELTNNTKIKVIGVGGAGGNAVNTMIEANIIGADYIVANTDGQDLHKSLAIHKIALGTHDTKSQGAGGDPEVGRVAAEACINSIEESIKDADMLFIAAGMGGGTGTGAAPVIAKKAREMGILTVGIVSLPFEDEGYPKMQKASNGVNTLANNVDSIIVIPNDKINELYEDLLFHEAFEKVNEVISNATQSVIEAIMKPGLMNIDFRDIKTMMTNKGYALMGRGSASGEDRAEAAAQMAIKNPLLSDVSLSGCLGLIINITVKKDTYRTSENKKIMAIITNETGKNCDMKIGLIYEESMDETLQVSIIATGLDKSETVKALPGNILLGDIYRPEIPQSRDAFTQPAIDMATTDKTPREEVTTFEVPRVIELGTPSTYKPTEFQHGTNQQFSQNPSYHRNQYN